ncbi:hypothetical protein RJ640_007240 [Escallonia rubra]|uniref:U6 snRNA phosphodiesterase n=1 Tax=Escallonia rubra TaxID=112253 RepID=A0AA88R3U9_9ASTE|nr:hypothetical protein RJ640_007240 [Escallonia rubra]
MESLMASYGDNSSGSDNDPDHTPQLPPPKPSSSRRPPFLPPPPLSLLNSPGTLDYKQGGQPNRVRSFPHVEGNYALHVYIPVHIPSEPKKELVQFLKNVTFLVPGLHVVDADVPLNKLIRDGQQLEQVALGREFHISLGRTVPIRVHQIDSVVAMLRQKLQFQRRYRIDFNKWEVFVNDDQTRSFISLETLTGGLAEIRKQIQAVNEVYKLHNLPEYYKDPRPHISIAWALGDISDLLKRVVEEEMKRYIVVGGSSKRRLFSCKFSGIECKVGCKIHKICRFPEDQ